MPNVGRWIFENVDRTSYPPPDLIEAKELPEELGRARPFRLKI